MTSRFSRRSVLAGAAALLSASPTFLHAQEGLGNNSAVTGAGSTFAFPVMSRWAHGYRRWVAGGGDFPIAGAGLDDAPTVARDRL